MAAAPFRIQTIPDLAGRFQVLRLSGALTISSVHELQETVRSSKCLCVILDFTAVPYLDSAGLGSLVGAYIAAQKIGRKLAFVGVNEKVKALMEMTHVAHLFPQFATVSEAEAKLL